MLLKVSSMALMSRLSVASKALASKNSLPILDCFLIEAEDGRMVITASDAEKSLITSVPVLEQEGTGRFCVSAKKMMDAIREIPEQPIELRVDEENYRIQGKHATGTFNITGQSADPYPTPRALSDEGTCFNLPASVITNGLGRTLFATANDEIRLVMNGVYFDIHTDNIIFAATDGRKLVKDLNKGVETGVEGNFILPKKVANILRSVLSASDDAVEIRYTQDRATISTADVTMHFRLIEGNYPNYNAVIPQNNPFRATVDRLSLAGALKRVLVFCNQASGLVKVELNDGTMKLTGQDNEYNTSGEETISCDYTGNHIAIGFSCQFMLEICNILESDNIVIELADPARPGVIRPDVPAENEEILMLLMPMRVDD